MKKIIALALVLVMIFAFVGCTSAEMVNHNLSQAADNFQVVRRIIVTNVISDTVLYTIEGAMSISNNSSNELVVTIMTGPNKYKKSYIRLNAYVNYLVEDITDTVTDPYHYKVHVYAAVPDIDFNS
jgi:hypothetical protein